MLNLNHTSIAQILCLVFLSFTTFSTTGKTQEKAATIKPQLTSSEVLKIQNLAREFIRNDLSFRECLAKTHIGKEKVETAFRRPMSQTAFWVHEQAVNTKCIELITNKASFNSLDANPAKEPKNSRLIPVSTEKGQQKEKSKELTKHAFIKLEKSCGSNQAGGTAFTATIYGVVSPYSIQGHEFWINKSKNYIGQNVYKGFLTKSGLVVVGQGRRTDKSKRWNHKYQSKGNKTIIEHLEDGLVGSEGENKYRRECKLTLLKDADASMALMWSNTKKRIGSLMAERQNLRTQRSELMSQVEQSKLNTKSLETEIAASAKLARELQDSLKIAENQLSLNMSKNSATNAEINKLKGLIQSKETQVEKQKQELDVISKLREEEKSEIAKLSRKNQEVVKELEAKNKEIKAKNAKLQELEILINENSKRLITATKVSENDAKNNEKVLKKLRSEIEKLEAQNIDLGDKLASAQNALKSSLSKAELQKKIDRELDEKLSATVDEIKEQLRISDVYWSELTKEIGDGFTNFQAGQNRLLTIASFCLSNITKTEFALQSEKVNLGVGLGSGQRAFAVDEAMEALVAQSGSKTFPKKISANSKACGHAVFEIPINSKIDEGILFVLSSNEIVAIQQKQ